MKYSSIFQYAYLVFAVLFAYDGISKWGDGTNAAYISLGLAALAVFMFFFRRRFNKKFQNRNNQS
ncbi:LPXTG cell wall anchor domain-containing protein [Seonamhaeicola sediminis]|uniref:LPXTG cell wall anchor domain-containing protein n=1 Tax=Seonamhaeicola sediminis TaxID=2528206 RepID=A0A562YG04_9FLAO|nr:LPXTG cell wall anchor domain-containing protein [Seonamhaeicola sediminis]TWO33315.1 LPXTG cell wall anchor domain-containing protein [Seonamhaeicola sediminis]